MFCNNMARSVVLKRFLVIFVTGSSFFLLLSVIQPKPEDFSSDEIAEFNLCVSKCGKWRIANFTDINNTLPYGEADYASQDFKESTCSDEATARGSNQSVIAFSFYGAIKHEREYFEGIETNVQLTRMYYPGWIMRLYHNVQDERSSRYLCQLQCSFPNILDLCFAGNIPKFGNLLGTQQNMWRFLPLADKLVNTMLSRDLDSMLSQREQRAVREWLKSGRPMHMMRDNHQHSALILAGMWGARVADHFDVWSDALYQMLYEGRKAGNKGTDQRLLGDKIWPLGLIPGWLLQHDSYFCENKSLQRGLTLPFPTRRLNSSFNFVGARRAMDYSPYLWHCPKACRKNKDWITC